MHVLLRLLKKRSRKMAQVAKDYAGSKIRIRASSLVAFVPWRFSCWAFPWSFEAFKMFVYFPVLLRVHNARETQRAPRLNKFKIFQPGLKF